MITILALLALPFAIGLRARAFTWKWRLLVVLVIGVMIAHGIL